ncbi:MAG: hypothetical protein BWY31_03632 [Lentisphaerae bacterium ADurb.Bin242]|nr:MAG: hypothetical protein BWY31_03632 [Lentisphaerae bacterium ADurb.Bin242]
MMKHKMSLSILSATVSFSLAAANLLTGDVSAEAGKRRIAGGGGGAYGMLMKIYSDDSTAFHGKKSVRIDWDLSRDKYRVPTYRDGNIYMRTLPLERGKTYTLSLYAKASHDDYPIGIGMLSVDCEGGRYHPVKLTREWQRYTIHFIPQPVAKASREHIICLGFRHNVPEKSSVWIDAVQLEKGENATPFENPEKLVIELNLGKYGWENIYSKGEAVPASINIVDFTGKMAGEIRGRVLDYKGNPVSTFGGSFQSSGVLNFKLPSDHYGWFKAVVETVSNGKAIASDNMTYVVLKEPVKIEAGIEPYCGIINQLASGTDDHAPLLHRIGVKRVQVTRYHREVEKKPGVYDWTSLEFELKLAKENGMVVKFHTKPFDPPDWYKDKNELEELKTHKKHITAKLLYRKPQFSEWTKFLHELMVRYGSLIDEFELGGEDNGAMGMNSFYMAKYPEGIKTDNSGQPWIVTGPAFDDYCELNRIGAAEIRKIKPEMKIGSIRPWGGTSPYRDDWLFVRAVMKQIGKIFSVFPCDPYFSWWFGPDKHPNWDFDSRFYTREQIRKLSSEYGRGDIPAYISECGNAFDPLCIDESPYRREHAIRTAKDMVAARAAGFYAYDLYGGICMDDNCWGLTQEHKLQSATASYSQVAHILENVTESQYRKQDSIVRVAVFRKKDGSGTAAIWADNGYRACFPEALVKDAVFSDLMGNVIPAEKEREIDSTLIYVTHKNYLQLAELLGKAEFLSTRYCQIHFRAVGEQKAQVKFTNLSNTRDVTITAIIENNGNRQKEEITIPRGYSLIRTLDHVSGVVKASASKAGTPFSISTNWEFPGIRTIQHGKIPQSPVGLVKTRANILPADPWVPWSGMDDLSADIKASWDKDYLYITAVVKDDQHFNTFKSEMYKADSLEIALDPKNNGSFVPLTGTEIIGNDDIDMGLSLANDGKIWRRCYIGQDNGVCQAENSRILRDNQKGTTTYEIRFPWKALGVTPHAGMVFGMSFVIFDDDTGKGFECYGYDGSGVAGGKNPALYNRYILK